MDHSGFRSLRIYGEGRVEVSFVCPVVQYMPARRRIHQHHYPILSHLAAPVCCACGWHLGTPKLRNAGVESGLELVR